MNHLSPSTDSLLKDIHLSSRFLVDHRLLVRSSLCPLQHCMVCRRYCRLTAGDLWTVVMEEPHCVGLLGPELAHLFINLLMLGKPGQVRERPYTIDFERCRFAGVRACHGEPFIWNWSGEGKSLYHLGLRIMPFCRGLGPVMWTCDVPPVDTRVPLW
jgi:hypothetical protein